MSLVVQCAVAGVGVVGLLGHAQGEGSAAVARSLSATCMGVLVGGGATLLFT
jgi:hypothetical protein